MPHRSTMYIHVAYYTVVTSRVAWSVGLCVTLSVNNTSEICKNGWSDRVAVKVQDSGGPNEPCIWTPHGVQIPPWEEAILTGEPL